MMNNFVFVQKPGEVNYQFKEPIDLNRNFTNSYMSSQVFIKKDSSVSSQSFLEGRSDYTGIDIPISPNLAKQTFHNFNYKLEYERLVTKSKKKEEKFKKVLIEFQNQVMIKDSVISGLEKQLDRIRGQSDGVATRELNKARDTLKQYESLLEKSEKNRKETEYQLQKSMKKISDYEYQLKQRLADYRDSTKPKQYYISKLIQCQNALRDRQVQMQKFNYDLVHSRSQLEYAQKTIVQQDKISLIKALNAKRLIEDQLNKTVNRLSNQLNDIREKYSVSQESRAKLQFRFNENIKKINQLMISENQYIKDSSKLKQVQSQVVTLSHKNSKKEEEVSTLKANIQRLNSISISQGKQIGQLSNELSLQKQKYSLLLAQKEVTQLKYKQQKINFSSKFETSQQNVTSAKLQVQKGLERIDVLTKQLKKEQDSKTQATSDLLTRESKINQATQENKKQIIRIREQNKNMTSLINQLNQQVSNRDQLYQTIKKLRQQKNQLTLQNSQFSQKITDLKKNQNTLNSKISQLTSEIRGLQILLKETDTTTSQNDKTKNLMELKIVKQQEHLETLTENNKMLKQQITELDNKILFLQEEKRNVLVRVEETLKEKDIEVKKGIALNESIYVVLREKKGAQQSAVKTQLALRQTEEKLIKKQEQISDLKSTIDSLSILQQSLKGSQNLSQSHIHSLETANKTLKMNEEQLRNQLTQKQSKLVSKTEQFKQFTQQLENLILRLQQIQEENQSLQSKVVNLTNAINKVEQQKANCQKQIVKLEQQNQTLLQALRQKQQTDIQSMKSLEQKQTQNSELIQKVESLQITLKSIKEQSEQNAIRLSEELIEAAKAQQMIEGKLSNSSKLLQEQQTKRKEVQKLLKVNKPNIKMQLEAALNSNKQINKKFEEVKKEKAQLVSTISSLKQQVKLLKKSEKSKIKRVEEKQKPKQQMKLEKTKSRTDNQLVQLRGTIQKHKINEDTYTQQIAGLKTSLKSYIQNYELLGKQKDMLIVASQRFQSRMEQIKMKLENQQKQLQNKQNMINSLEQQLLTIRKELDQKNQKIQTLQSLLIKNQKIKQKLQQIEIRTSQVQNINNALQQQIKTNKGLLNYVNMRQLVASLVDQTANKLFPHTQQIKSESSAKQDRTAAVQKHILQLISKIQWMQENLNFINQQNNDLQIELDQKDNVIFDIRKALEKSDMAVREMKIHVDKSNKRLSKNESLIQILNKQLLALQFKQGNQKYMDQEENQQQARFQVIESGEYNVTQSIDN